MKNCLFQECKDSLQYENQLIIKYTILWYRELRQMAVIVYTGNGSDKTNALCSEKKPIFKK